MIYIGIFELVIILKPFNFGIHALISKNKIRLPIEL